MASDLASIRNGREAWNWSDPEDPYWGGKEMAMYARIALIADEVGLATEVSRRRWTVACKDRGRYWSDEGWIMLEGDGDDAMDWLWWGVVWTVQGGGAAGGAFAGALAGRDHQQPPTIR